MATPSTSGTGPHPPPEDALQPLLRALWEPWFLAALLALADSGTHLQQRSLSSSWHSGHGEHAVEAAEEAKRQVPRRQRSTGDQRSINMLERQTLSS